MIDELKEKLGIDLQAQQFEATTYSTEHAKELTKLHNEHLKIHLEFVEEALYGRGYIKERDEAIEAIRNTLGNSLFRKLSDAAGKKLPPKL